MTHTEGAAANDLHVAEHRPPSSAWAAVILMVVGFTVCTLAFIFGNNIVLWVVGGVIGGAGVVLAKVSNLMSHTH